MASNTFRRPGARGQRIRKAAPLFVELLETRDLPSVVVPVNASLPNYDAAHGGTQLVRDPVLGDFNGDNVKDLAVLTFASAPAGTKSLTVYQGMGAATALTSLGTAPVMAPPPGTPPLG